jgi:(1->4)-alpha-D-glucan 1-alpha-D-glucosylmutase
MIKSVREGKERSSWSYPNADYETGLVRFVRGALDAARPNPFLSDFASFIELLARPAAVASLAQLILKLTVPGVPDIYQGGELWDFNMVDPDNRRPVDFAHRRAVFDEIAAVSISETSERWQDGREKLFVTARLLALRRDHPKLFALGDYQPLDTGEGWSSDRLCAFARRHHSEALIVVVPHLTYGIHRDGGPADFGSKIAVPASGPWREIFSGAEFTGRDHIRGSELFAQFPVAVLFGEGLE